MESVKAIIPKWKLDLINLLIGSLMWWMITLANLGLLFISHCYSVILFAYGFFQNQNFIRSH